MEPELDVDILEVMDAWIFLKDTLPRKEVLLYSSGT